MVVLFALTELGCSGDSGMLFQHSDCLSHIQKWTSIRFKLNCWTGLLFNSFSSLSEEEVPEGSVYLLSNRALASGRFIC